MAIDDTEREVCFQCGAPCTMTIWKKREGDLAMARFCDEHAQKWKKSNLKRRGEILDFLRGWITARRRAARAAARKSA